MGIVEVASFTARVPVEPWVTITATLRRSSSAAHRVTILFSLRKAMLDNDVLSFYVTQLTQSLHEGFDTVRGIGREAGT
jgi:hypothetical protein